MDKANAKENGAFSRTPIALLTEEIEKVGNLFAEYHNLYMDEDYRKSDHNIFMAYSVLIHALEDQLSEYVCMDYRIYKKLRQDQEQSDPFEEDSPKEFFNFSVMLKDIEKKVNDRATERGAKNA